MCSSSGGGSGGGSSSSSGGGDCGGGGSSSVVASPPMSAPAAAPAVVSMPPRVRALLHSSWAVFDPDSAAAIGYLNERLEFGEFAHARSTFQEHLEGTFGVLGAWGQPPDICRCGLFHTAYSGDLFSFFYWDAANESHRRELSEVVGHAAEEMIWHFGTVHRGSIASMSAVIDGHGADAPRLSADPDERIALSHRLQGSLEVSNALAAKLIVVTIADYLEQMVAVNGWRDHHQHEDLADVLYPGDGRPAVALYWLSALCRAVRHHLEVVPPVFDGCTSVLAREDEEAAVTSYWTVVLQESSLSPARQTEMLEVAAARNPFVGEPHVLLAQLAYRAGDYARARAQAGHALAKMYALCTQWDKRRSYANWVAYTRMLHLRASRKLEGLASWPLGTNTPPSHSGMPLASIRDIVSMLP